jgi:amino acid permease
VTAQYLTKSLKSNTGMASTAVNYGAQVDQPSSNEKVDREKYAPEFERRRISVAESIEISTDSTHRKLKPRHIQLIGIGDHKLLFLP